MKLRLIRNATLRLIYAGHTFVIDPFLAPKESYPSYAGRSRNPIVDLPCTPEEVIEGIEMVVVSHLHTDHFDPLAQDLLPRDLLLFCQPEDETRIREKGFLQVTSIVTEVVWRDMTIRRMPGQHGSSEAILSMMGQVSGFIFQAEHEPTVYWAGDTILYEGVSQAITEWQPDIIITHSSGAVWGDNELIVMDAGQTVAVCQQAPESIVVATHMESLDHGSVSRAELRQQAQAAGIPPAQLLIPENGAWLEL